jgi:voltage-gated potassium channel
MFRRCLKDIRRFFSRNQFISMGAGFLFFFASTAFLFWFLEHDHPDQQGALDGPLDVIYWWLITCTTVGYGDISPKTPAGKVLVGFMVIVGVSIVTTMVARMGSFFVERRMQFMKGHGQMDHLADHIVVCGWHDDLDGILRFILQMGMDLEAGRIVLINQIDPERVNGLRSRQEFKEMNFVSGDFTDQADLRRAGVERAKSVMFLVNPGEAGADSIALLGVMAVRQLSKKVHLCAQVSEERFLQYMLEAGCDEVIHLGSLRRSLTAQVVLEPGIGNIFHDLLDLESGAFMAVEEVPEALHGQTFADLQRVYTERGDALLIGLLENVGNPYEMKQQAIRDAQMAPDISQLVSQLRSVKEKTPHAPVLCPAPDRVIEPRTRAVVIRRSEMQESA